ncbi:hypothetical protein PGT21_002317 [Puccinia graminis f. sp. tritici]|uniref:Uncharacterized protein n=1 Tax=Puccinia graminis f. sp. tritici TaxID=56615 RepID=A0A5B0MSY1_PUCGR|nr:hypothetical protein PGTUg99_012129 [Puccinia graminis f. sp. tritici]KAA1103843.1 hypothetical protein PGT21_002317 [Puccinia graminis f. sp. tritici]
MRMRSPLKFILQRLTAQLGSAMASEYMLPHAPVSGNYNISTLTDNEPVDGETLAEEGFLVTRCAHAGCVDKYALFA